MKLHQRLINSQNTCVAIQSLLQSCHQDFSEENATLISLLQKQNCSASARTNVG